VLAYKKITSIKKINQKTKVYNFHVPKFESYVANGIVTHNCYVSRHRQLGNGLEQLTNWEDIWEITKLHWQSLDNKLPNQCDPKYWTYDIGESTDCMLPQNINATKWFIKKFLTETTAKPTFATKLANTDALPALLPEYKSRARVRISLMPQKISTILEPVTSPIKKRITAINTLVHKNYEVHINFSPVVLYDTWETDYKELFETLVTELTPEALSQIKAEVIFLTHHPKLHELNLKWAPKAEELLWMPKLQETKTTQRGDANTLRYKSQSVKPLAIKIFTNHLNSIFPHCNIRYIF